MISGYGWILIMIMHQSIDHIEFVSKEQCLEAAEQVKSKDINVLCISRDTKAELRELERAKTSNMR